MATTTNAVAPFGIAGSRLTGNGIATLPMMKGGNTAFNVYRNAAQSIANNTFVKILCDTKVFDTGTMFDVVTNNRFTPTIAGKYFFAGTGTFSSIVGSPLIALELYRNGAAVSIAQQAASSTVSNTMNTFQVLDMNGSTDYVELYIYQNSGGSINLTPGIYQSFLSGILLEAS